MCRHGIGGKGAAASENPIAAALAISSPSRAKWPANGRTWALLMQLHWRLMSVVVSHLPAKCMVLLVSGGGHAIIGIHSRPVQFISSEEEVLNSI
jgi:hypothetical protein